MIFKSIFFVVFGFIALTQHILFAENHEHIDMRGFKIAIFKEDGFPSLGTPDSLTPEWLYSSLSRCYSVSYLDFNHLGDNKYLNVDNFDILVLPYGEAFPYKAFPAIKKFIFSGGGLFHLAGRPFWVPFSKTNGVWEKTETDDPYSSFLAELGIKYYEYPDSQNIGLTVSTGSAVHKISPTHGNVFPYRVPVRDFYLSAEIIPDDNHWPIIFVKTWRNPYVHSAKDILNKYCLVGAKGEKHPLNPNDLSSEEMLIKIMRYLSFPVIMHGLESNYASYYQGEKVTVCLEVMNQGEKNEIFLVDITFLDNDGKAVHKKTRKIKLASGRRIVLNEIWHPGEFKSNFYKIVAVIKQNEEVFDKEVNGFIILNKNILGNGSSMYIKGKEFVVNGEAQLIFGANYYESRLGELMWIRPNIFRVREDFKSMRKLGLNFVRIHYHHSKWFRDYFSYALKQAMEPYFKVADTTVFPSERSWRILDAIIYLAQEQGLIFCMDIFSLVPREMGDPLGWLGLRERIVDDDRVAMQKKFVALLAKRYKDVPGITWDLWNEPRIDAKDNELLRNWIRDIRQIFMANGDRHLITLGDDSSLYLMDVLDYACIHTYEPEKFVSLKNNNIPFVFQEVWNETGNGLAEEEKQSEELIKDFHGFLEAEAGGFIPWQWTRQARLWSNISESERWDDELGVCTHEDGTLKPAGRTYSQLITSSKRE